MALIDATFLRDELHWLAARIALYDGIADAMVVVEGTHTFQGQRRNLLLRDLDLPGWVRCEVIDLNDIDDPWVAERITRAALGELVAPGADDIVVSCDIDEFWNPARVDDIAAAARDAARVEGFRDGVASLGMDLRVFNPAWRCPPAGHNPKALTGAQLGCCSLAEARVSCGTVGVPDAGWHLSWMGGEGVWARKLASFAHTELNNAAGQAQIAGNAVAMRGPNGEQLIDVGIDGLPPVLVAAAHAPYRTPSDNSHRESRV